MASARGVPGGEMLGGLHPVAGRMHPGAVREVKFVNLCPHSLTIKLPDRELVLPAEGTPVRVTTKRSQAFTAGGVPVFVVQHDVTTGLPDPVPLTFYVVSMVVYQANPQRQDLLCPDTSPEGAIRDERGQITAVRGFAIYPF